MSTEIPYVYTDVDYDMITVTSGGLTATDTARGVSVVVGLLDHAEDVVALARAILAANGNTGHEVVSASGLDSQLPDRGGDIITDLDVALATRTDLTDEHRACYEAILSRVEEIRAERDRALHAARSMRERAAEIALDDPTADYDIRRQILNLPLLPDSADGASVSDAARVLSEIRERHAAEDLGDESMDRGAKLARAEAELRAALRTDVEARDAAYDSGFADGLRMGEARLSAVADSDGEGPETRHGRSRMTEESDG